MKKSKSIYFTELTDKLLAAQLFVFFAAGFETSSTTIGNALYELARNKSIQEKLRQEIRNELIQTNGKLTYDNIKNMKYLDKVIKGIRTQVHGKKLR